MLSSPTGGLSLPTLSKKPSNVSASNVTSNGRLSPERTRIVRPRPTRSSSGNSRPHGDSGSESDYDSGDALSFNDDEIPITGFAVATMKRNQDFHELFPQVTSDDYLIDGMSVTLANMTSVYDVCRLWLRSAKRYSHTRPSLYLRKPHLFPRKYIWMGDRSHYSS
jgi:hypothetical protein